LTGVLIYLQGRWRVAGGTSASAPAWAALIALAAGLAGHGLGSVNAALYRLACSSHFTRDFRDITLGSSLGPILNGAKLGGTGFRAGPGWDAVTGLGSPRAASLVPDLAQAARHPPAAGAGGACSGS
jgi:subtilase family serine protease